MTKPLIFISHIAEEAALAEIFRRYIEQSFLKLIDIFVFSSSTHLGDDWLKGINQNLRTANIVLVICSEESLARPWINFEVGAAWVTGIPLVPVCHTGLPYDKLPIPFSLFKAIAANNEKHLDELFALLASGLGSSKPVVSLKQMAADVAELEREYSRKRYGAAGVPHLLHHISLPVRDLNHSVDLYRKVLHLDPLQQAPSPRKRRPLPSERPYFGFGGAWFVLPSGQHLHLVENPDGTFRAPGKITPRDVRDCHFALRVRDFDCVKSRLLEIGCEFIHDPLGMGYQQLYFLDHDFHVVEINADRILG
jgi:catechol 2,3-dioxygenase-like lactoylglutathione lyase family enzyme